MTDTLGTTGEFIQIRGARVHNLRNIDLDIPRDQFVVITGLSGSGKSSLAFDTLFAEGQRRYIESLSVYARQFFDQLERPDVDIVDGLPPTISVDQRRGSANPRSTLATATEIYDYLRLLYARTGTPHCPRCDRPIQQQTQERMVELTLELGANRRVLVLAPLVRGRKGQHKDVFQRIRREGFVRARVDGKLIDVKDIPELAKNRAHKIDAVVDRLTIREGIRPRLAESIAVALKLGEGTVVVSAGTDGGWKDRLFSARLACPVCDIAYDELEPRMFSFNSPYGACPVCDGLGTHLEFDPELLFPEPSRPLVEGLAGAGRARRRWASSTLEEFARRHKLAPDVAIADLSEPARRELLHGHNGFDGVIPWLRRQLEETNSPLVREQLTSYMTDQPCRECGGSRLRPEARAVRVGGQAIHQVTARSVEQADDFFAAFALAAEHAVVGQPIVREIRGRLDFLRRLGLGYLTLDRPADTLSGGESQRVRLAAHIGSGLVGVCYVLDEPSVGLHPRDNERLLASLRRLQQQGNSVLVVEHDEATIRSADLLIDLGPGAGAHGGQVVACDTPQNVAAAAHSLTAEYLRGERGIAVPPVRRSCDLAQALVVHGARHHNLRNIDVRFPLGVFICVSGVSGSGKSSLVAEILCRALRRKLYAAGPKPGRHDRVAGARKIDKLVEIDQSPIGRSPRSNPATYTGLFDEIRRVFARTREAKIRGYTPGRFSFNVKGGRCEACEGQGTKKIEMNFLPDLHVTCEVCRGKRFNRQTLEIRYRGRSIADVLDMPVGEALEFFENFPAIHRLLATLEEVGLGYMALGQSATTLSGGESQRVKLAAELGRAATGKTLYVLDEPTTGLHFADIENLLGVLGRLADLGNTVIVIEHNLDVIKSADYVIDLGPEGGDAGGDVVASGTPEEIADCSESHTGRFLRKVLEARLVSAATHNGL